MQNRYEYSDLSEEEIQRDINYRKALAEQEAIKERARLKKMTSFRFSGGMC